MAIKGHAKIELTDVNTGEVEVIEHDNLVTNGFLKVLNKRGLCAAPAILPSCQESSRYPIYNWFRGLFLFESPLTEDPDDFDIPPTNTCVGYASNVINTTKISKRGSFNSTESSVITPDSRTAKFVWDFATHQANGIISSLALVPHIVGQAGWDNLIEEGDTTIYAEPQQRLYSTSMSMDADRYLYYDDENIVGIDRYNMKYSENYESKHISVTKKLSIVKRNFPMFGKKVSLFEPGGLWSDAHKQVIDIPLPDELIAILGATGTGYLKQNFFADYSNGHIYFSVAPRDGIGVGETFYILQISIEDFSTKLLTMTNTTDAKLWLGEVYNSGSTVMSTTSNQNGRIVDGKLFVCDNNYEWWLIDLDDNTKVQPVVYSSDLHMGNSEMSVGMVMGPYVFVTPKLSSSLSYTTIVVNTKTARAFYIYTGSSSNAFSIRSTAYDYHKKGVYIGSAYDKDMPHIFFRVYDATSYKWEISIYTHPFMLMTKNNLSAPITKTASQTMKVTYTLTEEYKDS